VHAKIPKRIIQTARSTDLSLLERAAVANLRLLNPDFEYIFFDDAQVESFIDTEFPQYRPTLDGFGVSIQRYDFFRYLAVYRLGGFYFDTDVLLASGLEGLLEFGCVFPFEELTLHRFLRRQYGMDWEIGNYAFAASAGHPFIEAIIGNCIRAMEHPEWAEAMIKSVPRILRNEFFVYDTTGPGLVSRTLAEYQAAGDQVRVLFPPDVCDPLGWHCFGSYGVHLQSGSWRKPRSFLRRYVNRLWEAATRRALLRESLTRGGKRSLEFKRPS
jgi:inositol phosphorylceramide mannosyltransferase catalytic subunit